MERLHLILLALLFSCSIIHCRDMCGKPIFPMLSMNDMGRGGARIVGGFQARPWSHPWLTYIYLDSGDDHHTCDGSLIRVSEKDETDILVTAGHCVFNQTTMQADPPYPSNITVSAGVHILQSHGRENFSRQFSEAIEAIWHPAYPEVDWAVFNDIAILKLANPIKFTPYAQPVCLPFPMGYVKSGTEVISAGWGLTTDNGDYPESLRQVSLTVISTDECTRQSDYAEWINGTVMICAGGGQSSKDTCNGDSGGALIEKIGEVYVMQGVVSFRTGEACGQANKPSGYTRVSNYVCWIYSMVKKYSTVYNSDLESGQHGFLSGIPECGPGAYIKDFNNSDGSISQWIKCTNGKNFVC